MQTTEPPLLGRYRIIEVRDRGGFGNVLVAWDIKLQRRVALKQIPLDTTEQTTTFEEALAEARASSFLAHPNIVTVYDFITDNDYAYLVMEYVDGCSLLELLHRVEGGVLVYDEAAYVFSALSSALAYAHENGVLHLDIKPANVLIDRAGNVKLTDFGMASLMSAAGFGDARGGTLGYMPPEQLTGDFVDERSDIFSLATVCYEALLGENPFKTRTDSQSLKAIKKGATPAHLIEEELPEETSAALTSAMAEDPTARMSSVEEFQEEALAPLGDAKEGKASLTSLLSEETEDDFAEHEWRALDTFATRHPLATKILAKAVTPLLVASIVFVSFFALSLHFPAIIPAWTSIVAPLAGAILAFFLPAVSALSCFWLLSFSAALINHTPAGLLFSAIIAILSAFWATRIAAYKPFVPALTLLPLATLLPAWNPGGPAFMLTSATAAGFSAGLGTAGAWLVWMQFMPPEQFFTLFLPIIALTSIASCTGGILAGALTKRFPYLAQLVSAICMLIAWAVAYSYTSLASFSIFAGINAAFLVGSLVLMFVLIWQFRRK